jgi:hypothetical protein
MLIINSIFGKLFKEAYFPMAYEYGCVVAKVELL